MSPTSMAAGRTTGKQDWPNAGGRGVFIKADLSHAIDVIRMFDEAEQKIGPLD